MGDERQLVFGKYVLQQRIGRGSMSVVFRALQSGPMGFRKPVAIKQLVARSGERERYLKRMVNEARISGLLRHRNLVEVYEFDEVDGTYYLSMEYVPGPTLYQLMARIAQQGPFPLEVAGSLLLQLCDGLAYAHEAVDETGRPMELIHRDIKPTNVMLSVEGLIKITDFGVARASTNLYRTQTAHVTRGTPYYMSPEQVRGKPIDRRSDLFSLGALGVQMITGVPLFADDNPMVAMQNVDRADVSLALDRVGHIAPELVDVLQRALRREPRERFEDAAAMASACGQAVPSPASRDALASWLKAWMAAPRAIDTSTALPAPPPGVGPDGTDPDQLTRPWYPPVEGRGAAGQQEATQPALWVTDLPPSDISDLALDSVPELSLTTSDSEDGDRSFPPDLTVTEEPPANLAATVESVADLTATEESVAQDPVDTADAPPDLTATEEPQADLTATEESVARDPRDTEEVEPLRDGDSVYDLSPAAEPSDESLPSYVMGEEEPATRTGRGGLYLVRIAPTTFWMGSAESEVGREGDEDLHEVHITQSFRIAATVLTRASWRELYGAEGGRPENGDLPVTGISWYDAVRLCNDLSERDGLKPAYRVSEGAVHWDRGATGFRLPTEAEWECAARAGAPTCFAGSDDPDLVAWHAGNSEAGFHPVGELRPNAVGLYDMCGNISEWVWDIYAPYPTGGASVDPRGPLTGTLRVHRGGSVFSPVEEVRSARRHIGGPPQPHADVGIRLARNG